MKLFIGAVLALLLPQVAAKCSTFNLTGEYGRDGFTVPSNSSWPMAPFLNCTAANAVAVSDGTNSTRNCPIHSHGVAAVTYSRVLFARVDAAALANILALAYNAVGSDTIDFNATIVMNLTYDGSMAAGQAGWPAFTPTLRCWDGVLSGCDKENVSDELEGRTVRPCGLLWLDGGQKFRDPGLQQYLGDETIVVTDDSGDSFRDSVDAYADYAENATYTPAGQAGLSAASRWGSRGGGSSGAWVGCLALTLGLYVAVL